MSKLPLERGATKSRICGMICDEHGGFDNGVLQELEVAVGSFASFLPNQKRSRERVRHGGRAETPK